MSHTLGERVNLIMSHAFGNGVNSIMSHALDERINSIMSHPFHLVLLYLHSLHVLNV